MLYGLLCRCVMDERVSRRTDQRSVLCLINGRSALPIVRLGVVCTLPNFFATGKDSPGNALLSQRASTNGLLYRTIPVLHQRPQISCRMFGPEASRGRARQRLGLLLSRWVMGCAEVIIVIVVIVVIVIIVASQRTKNSHQNNKLWNDGRTDS